MAEKQRVYKHHKGSVYLVTDIAQHTETGERLVIYYDVNAETEQRWARPESMFDDVHHIGEDGEPVKRFTLIAPEDEKDHIPFGLLLLRTVVLGARTIREAQLNDGTEAL